MDKEAEYLYICDTLQAIADKNGFTYRQMTYGELEAYLSNIAQKSEAISTLEETIDLCLWQCDRATKNIQRLMPIYAKLVEKPFAFCKRRRVSRLIDEQIEIATRAIRNGMEIARMLDNTAMEDDLELAEYYETIKREAGHGT